MASGQNNTPQGQSAQQPAARQPTFSINDSAKTAPNRPTYWLVPDWLPFRALTLLGGTGGAGKGLVSIRELAELTKPRTLPDGTSTGPYNVLYFNSRVSVASATPLAKSGRPEGVKSPSVRSTEQRRLRHAALLRPPDRPRPIPHQNALGRRGLHALHRRRPARSPSTNTSAATGWAADGCSIACATADGGARAAGRASARDASPTAWTLTSGPPWWTPAPGSATGRRTW